jgi:hypothetical protein
MYSFVVTTYTTFEIVFSMFHVDLPEIHTCEHFYEERQFGKYH